jgi:Transposase DDE domain
MLAIGRWTSCTPRFEELQERVFFTVANRLDLEVDLLFFDTTSTYWEIDRLPEELQDEGEHTDSDQEPDQEPVLVESGRRRYSKNSKDHRPDLPQVMVGMAVTRKGIPVRVWTFPGNASDQVIVRKVKDDLRGWNLARVIWVLDRGFTSERNRRYLQRAGGHYIVGEKLRSDSKEANTALARQGRYHTVARTLECVSAFGTELGAARRSCRRPVASGFTK